MQFWIFFWLLFCFVSVSVFVFVFVFFFLIIQSQAAFLNCLHVARFTTVHSKTQIKFPLLLLYFFYGNDRFFFPNSAGVDILSLRYLWRLTLNGQHLLAGCNRAQANTALLYQSSSLKRNTFFFLEIILFITSTLKSLAIRAIWLALSGVIYNGNWTKWSAIWSEIIRVISKSN